MTDETRIPGDIRLSRRKVLIGLGMAAASGTAFARMPTPNRPPIEKTKFESLMPNTVGSWRFASESGVVLPPPDALSERMYDNLVTRVYTGPRGPIMFLAAYNNRQDGVIQIHRPETCYPAGGFVLSETREVPVQFGPSRTLPAKAFLARGHERDETVLYWTRVGDDFPRRWSEQKIAVVGANIRGIIPDGLLVRVSTVGGDMPVELEVLKSFIAEFVAAAPTGLRPILLGSNSA